MTPAIDDSLVIRNETQVLPEDGKKFSIHPPKFHFRDKVKIWVTGETGTILQFAVVQPFTPLKYYIVADVTGKICGPYFDTQITMVKQY